MRRSVDRCLYEAVLKSGETGDTFGASQVQCVHAYDVHKCMLEPETVVITDTQECDN